MFGDECRPVLFRLGDVRVEIFIELLQDRFIQVEIEFAVANLPSADIHREQCADRHAESAVTTALRGVFFGCGLEQFLVRLGSEYVSRALIGGRYSGVAVHRLAVREERHSVVTADSDVAGAGDIDEVSGLRGGRQSDGGEGEGEELFDVFHFVFL